MINDDRAQEEFRCEAIEVVEGLGRDLLDLDDDAQKFGRIDPELLKKVFHAACILTGLSRFLCTTRFTSLTVEFECIVGHLRLGQIALTVHVLDMLYASVQVFGQLLVAAKEGRDEPPPEFDELLAKLRDVNATTGRFEWAKSNPEVEQLSMLTYYEWSRLRANIAQGTTIYRLRVKYEMAP